MIFPVISPSILTKYYEQTDNYGQTQYCDLEENDKAKFAAIFNISSVELKTTIAFYHDHHNHLHELNNQAKYNFQSLQLIRELGLLVFVIGKNGLAEQNR